MLRFSLLFVLAACPKPEDTQTPVDTDTDIPAAGPQDWGAASDTPYLPGAVMVSEDDWNAALPDLLVVGPDDDAKNARDAALQTDKDEAAVVDWLVNRGGADSVLARMIAEGPTLDETTTELFDGNLSILLNPIGRERVGHEVVTLGRPSLASGYRSVINKLDDPANNRGAYRRMYELAPDAFRELQMMTPDEVDTLSDDDTLRVFFDMSQLIDRLRFLLDPGGIPPQSRPETCAGEVEAGANSDRTSGNADTEQHSATGIYENFDWPQKWYATCVKDQAGRGTCGSFGITAAMETGIALQFDRWVNLSEQDLYNNLRGEWNPSSYGDGLVTHAAWQDMLTHDYLQPFEAQWPYNPSRSRIANDDTATYTGSCTDYQFSPNPSFMPNYCSDTVHQGGAWCVNVGFWQACGYLSPVGSDNTSGYRAADEFEVWDASTTDSKDTSLSVTQLVLDLKMPTVLWAFVTPSFDSVDADGFVPYFGSAEGNRGSHIYQITGYIDNNDLINTLGNAPEGAGGGYIIAKNSWGDGWGDAGYAYLPYQWVKDYAVSVTVLDGMQ